MIVLAPGEQPGGGNNRGCRLTEDQVHLYMKHLAGSQADNIPGNAAWFCASIGYNWPPERFTVLSQGYQRDDNILRWFAENMNPNSNQTDNNWDQDAVNIYFTGNIINPNLPGVQLFGHNVDPREGSANPQLPLKHHMIINDRNGMVAPGDHVLEHEMCHFLIRQKSGAPPAGQNGRYDDAEHDPTPGAAHLMQPHTVRGPISSQDGQEACTRVTSGNGTNP